MPETQRSPERPTPEHMLLDVDGQQIDVIRVPLQLGTRLFQPDAEFEFDGQQIRYYGLTDDNGATRPVFTRLERTSAPTDLGEAERKEQGQSEQAGQQELLLKLKALEARLLSENQIYLDLSTWSEGMVIGENPQGKKAYFALNGTMLPTQWFDDARPFSEGRAVVQEDNAKWRIIRRDGRPVGETYSAITGNFDNGSIVVSNERGEVSRITLDGKTIRTENDPLAPVGAIKSQIFGNKFIFIDVQKGKQLNNYEYDYAEDFCCGRALIVEGGRRYFLKSDGMKLNLYGYARASSFVDGIAWVSDDAVGETFYPIDIDGKRLTELDTLKLPKETTDQSVPEPESNVRLSNDDPEYVPSIEELDSLEARLAEAGAIDYLDKEKYTEGRVVAVRIDSDGTLRFNYATLEGKILSEQWFYEADTFSNGRACVRTSTGEEYSFIRRDGQLLNDKIFATAVSFQNGRATVLEVTDTNQNIYTMDIDGKPIPNEELTATPGQLEQLANIVKLRYTYRKVGDFCEGRAKVILPDGKQTYVVLNGQDARALNFEQYEYCNDFSEGRAVVLKNGQFLVLKRDGSRLNQETYDFAVAAFKNGKLAVEQDGERFFIDIDGNRIELPTKSETATEQTVNKPENESPQDRLFAKLQALEAKLIAEGEITSMDMSTYSMGRVLCRDENGLVAFFALDGTNIRTNNAWFKEARPFSDARAVIKDALGYWIIRRDGSNVRGPYFDIQGRFENGLVQVSDMYGKRMVNVDSNDVAGATAVAVAQLTFSEGRGKSTLPSGKIGFFQQSTGTPLNGEEYDEAEDFSCGRALVRQGDRYHFIRSNGSKLNTTTYYQAKSFKDGIAWVREVSPEDDEFFAGPYAIDVDGNELDNLDLVKPSSSWKKSTEV